MSGNKVNEIKVKFETNEEKTVKNNPLLEEISLDDSEDIAEKQITRRKRSNCIIDKSYDKIVEEFFSYGKCKYQFSLDNLALIITKVMEFVEINDKDLSGPSKKDIVIKITKKLMNDLEVVKEDEEILEKNEEQK